MFKTNYCLKLNSSKPLAINDCELTNTISKFIFFDLVTQFQLAIHLL